MPHIVLAFN